MEDEFEDSLSADEDDTSAAQMEYGRELIQFNRLLAKILTGMLDKMRSPCPRTCASQDRPLAGRKDFANFLNVTLQFANNLGRCGLPHAVIGNRWIGNTDTVMQWLTQLVKNRVHMRAYSGHSQWDNLPKSRLNAAGGAMKTDEHVKKS